MIRVIAFVGDRGARSEAIDKLMCEGNAVALPRRPNQAERIAERAVARCYPSCHDAFGG